MQPSYIFYDIESSGLNPCFDQVLQFAAIRTDLNLNEIDRLQIMATLNPDTIIAPEALITHQIGLDRLDDGISEYQAIQTIHQWLNEPGSISIGYNTLGFDDEFLRFSFYRNLLPPYTHQYAQQCGRADLLPIACMYRLFHPNIINWPDKAGKPSLKLELINEANQYAKGQAHDAMVDVEATLGLARAFYQERATWDYLLGYFNKNQEQQRFFQLSTAWPEKPYRLAIYALAKLGAANNYLCPALGLGQHNHYRNQSLWLRLDHGLFADIETDQWLEKCWVMHKKAGEPGFLLPTKPRFSQRLNTEQQQLMTDNLDFLANNPERLNQLIEHHLNYTYPKQPDIDAAASLYTNGFASNTDQTLMAAFHQADWPDKPEIAEQFQSRALTELAGRIIGRNQSQHLSASQQADFQQYLQQVKTGQLIKDHKGNQRLTPKAALDIIQKLYNENQLSETQLDLLRQLQQQLETIQIKTTKA